MSVSEPLRWVVMGASGCGKSTLALALGQAFNLHFVDGDDLHLPASVAKMRAGIALSDEDRWPWLDRVADVLSGPGCVVACSALRRAYRDHLRARVPGLQFLFLDGDPALLHQRMAQRAGHFMQPQLLDSQLSTLERPAPDEADTLTLPADWPVAALTAHVVQRCRPRPAGAAGAPT